MIITDADEEKVTIGDNVLLIGYMLGIHSVTSNLPPYTRKGSIATTYIQDVPLKSDFVIDIYSGYGMSGSPIILDGDHLKLLGIQKQAYNADAFGSVSMKTGDKILDVNDIRACTRIPIHTAVGIKASEISDLKLVV
jgi:hypothetical protein